MSGWEAYLDSQLLLKDASGQQTAASPINFGALLTTEGSVAADQGFSISAEEAAFLAGVVKQPDFKDDYKCANAFKHSDGSVGSYTLGGRKYVVSRSDDGIVLSSHPVPEGETATGVVIGVSATMIILAHVYDWADQTNVQTASDMVAKLKNYLEEIGY